MLLLYLFGAAECGHRRITWHVLTHNTRDKKSRVAPPLSQSQVLPLPPAQCQGNSTGFGLTAPHGLLQKYALDVLASPPQSLHPKR